MKHTHYHEETPAKVRHVLETARLRGTWIRVYYGDPDTGRCWNDEHDVYGYVGRSTGTKKIPLLLHNTRSIGGGGILDHCIVRIVTAKGKRELYRHPDFRLPKMTIAPLSEAYPDGGPKWWEDFPGDYTHSVLFDGDPNANFTSEDKAKRYIRHLS